MNKEQLRAKWEEFDASLVEKGEELEEKKHVLQEIAHDDLNSENIA